MPRSAASIAGTFITGIITIEPERSSGLIFSFNSEQVRIPSGSSPWIPPLIQKHGPGFAPLIIVTGIVKSLPPASFSTKIFPSTISPGLAFAEPISIIFDIIKLQLLYTFLILLLSRPA